MPEPIRLGTLRKTSLDEGGDGRTKNPTALAVGSVKFIKRDKTVELHVCPNHCDAYLSTCAHVLQDWKVDAFGDFIEEIETLETVHGPDNGNIWTCTECGAEAELIECTQFDEVGFSICVPVTPRGCVFLLETNIPQYIPITPDGRGIPCFDVDGERYYLQDFQ